MMDAGFLILCRRSSGGPEVHFAATDAEREAIMIRYPEYRISPIFPLFPNSARTDAQGQVRHRVLHRRKRV